MMMMMMMCHVRDAHEKTEACLQFTPSIEMRERGLEVGVEGGDGES